MFIFTRKSKPADVLLVHLIAGSPTSADTDLTTIDDGEERVMNSGLDPIGVDFVLRDKTVLPGLPFEFDFMPRVSHADPSSRKLLQTQLQ